MEVVETVLYGAYMGGAIYRGVYVGKEKPRPIMGEAVCLANVC